MSFFHWFMNEFNKYLLGAFSVPDGILIAGNVMLSRTAMILPSWSLYLRSHLFPLLHSRLFLSALAECLKVWVWGYQYFIVGIVWNAWAGENWNMKGSWGGLKREKLLFHRLERICEDPLLCLSGAGNVN